MLVHTIYPSAYWTDSHNINFIHKEEFIERIEENKRQYFISRIDELEKKLSGIVAEIKALISELKKELQITE